MTKPPIPVLFHRRQLAHTPAYEWTFGEKIAHPETVSRAERIVAAIEADPATFSVRPPAPLPESIIARTHDPRLVQLYRAAQQQLAEGTTFYPSVFPKRDQTTPDPNDIRRGGFFCFDSGTPLMALTWEAATWSAACASDAATLVATGKESIAYALCRPPGHHASRDLFGGYCYLNNAAFAVAELRRLGRTCVLDIDFHHGNGTQAMFYRDPTVLFISIHGDPREFYPYFSGYSEERGAGRGEGFTLNVPLPKGCDGSAYCDVLERVVLPKIREFAPASLVLSAGFDTYREDPIGRFTLETANYADVGGRIASLGLPTVVVQEGGYCTEALGHNVVTLLHGMRGG